MLFCDCVWQRKQPRDLRGSSSVAEWRITNAAVDGNCEAALKGCLGFSAFTSSAVGWMEEVFLEAAPGLCAYTKSENIILLYSTTQRSALWRQMGNSNLGGQGERCLPVEQLALYIPCLRTVQWGVHVSGFSGFLCHLRLWSCFSDNNITAGASPGPSSIKMPVDWHKYRVVVCFTLTVVFSKVFLPSTLSVYVVVNVVDFVLRSNLT